MAGVDYTEVVRLFKSANYPPAGLNSATAWLGIYQILVTYQYGVPQIADKDVLEEGMWRRRAEAFEEYLAGNLRVPRADVAGMVGQIMQHPYWRGMQINNVRGHGFRAIISQLLRDTGSACDFEEEARARDWFPGIRLPGASENPAVDILAAKGDQPRAVISCKWTVRHDRVSDITNECPNYRSVAVRQRVPEFGYYVVTNEFYPSRLQKMLNDDCITGVVHVNSKALAAAGLKVQARKPLTDLSDFLTVVARW